VPTTLRGAFPGATAAARNLGKGGDEPAEEAAMAASAPRDRLQNSVMPYSSPWMRFDAAGSTLVTAL
jgi:hypothetical protein